MVEGPERCARGTSPPSTQRISPFDRSLRLILETRLSRRVFSIARSDLWHETLVTRIFGEQKYQIDILLLRLRRVARVEKSGDGEGFG